MLVSYNWLKEYIDLDDLSADDVANLLTNAGVEVESVRKQIAVNNLSSAIISECHKHPKSDHLKICTVNTDNQSYQIVCGAKNAREGIKVILAKEGAILPSITIKKTKILNIESEGMLCSLKEIGVDPKILSDEELNGIHELASDIKLGLEGEELLKELKLDDYLLDLKPTPNRADLFSIYGIVNELSAILGRENKLKEYIDDYALALNPFKISIDTKDCDKLYTRLIKGIEIKESPEFIKRRLAAVGINTINNLVDISNYVMYELGQPLHFYDAAKLDSDLCVSNARNEKYTALDGNEYQLKDDIVIRSNNNIVGIAGIMGGDDSKIDTNTNSILIEAAIFDKAMIRNSSRRLNLSSESSYRFTKGIDPNNPLKAIIYATHLLCKYANAKEISKINFIDNKPFKENSISISLKQINTLLGSDFTKEEVNGVFTNLKLRPEYKDDLFHCIIPSYRQDLKIAQDLCEEVIRLLGFDRLKEIDIDSINTKGNIDEDKRFIRKTKSIWTGFGFNEVITYSLIAKEGKQLLAQNEGYKLLSPLSLNRAYVRSSLFGSLLETASYNKARKIKNIKIFEISDVYAKDLYESRLAVYLDQDYLNSKFLKIDINSDFYILKGFLNTYFTQLGINGIEYRENDLYDEYFYLNKSAKIYHHDKLIGLIGYLHPNILNEYDLTESLYLEIRLNDLIKSVKDKVEYQAISIFPSVKRDLALIVRNDVKAEKIIKLIKDNCDLVKDIEVFDLYRGKNIDNDHYSLALSLSFEADYTLTEEELKTHIDKILVVLNEGLGISLRG